MSSFTLESIFGYRTKRVLFGSSVVGHLYRPDDLSPEWELWARGGQESVFPGWDRHALKMTFKTEDEALGYLGIQTEQEVAA